VLADGNKIGYTPVSVKLSRRKNHVITITEEGYAVENIAVTKSIGGAVAGNILAGGLIGWGVDATTGAQYNLHPNVINVRLHRLTDSGMASSQGAKSKTAEFVEELNKLDELLEKKKVTQEEYQKMRQSLVEKYQK